MSSVKPHVFALLDVALRALRDDLAERTSSSGIELRSSQRRLLSLVPPEGVRVTELAQRAGMTAQALGEFARRLADLELLEFARDPGDGRVRILRLTAAGKDAAREDDRAVRAMESAWRRRVGAEDWETFRNVLARIGEVDLGSDT